MASIVPKSALETEYYKVLEAAAKNKPQKDLMRHQWVNMMIERIESAKKIVADEGGDSLHPTVKEGLATYDVVEVGNFSGKIEKRLVLKKKESTGEIIPLSETFPLVMKAHKFTKHGGVDPMSEWLSNSNIVVSEICLHSLIKVCCKNKPIKVSEDPKQRNCKTEGVITILDMALQESDDNFNCLLIYEDNKTKFLLLRPINSADMVDSISNELIHLFSDLGPPECITVQPAFEDIFKNILNNRLNVFFRPKISLKICEKSASEVTQKVQSALTNWLSKTKEKKWPVGCYIVQWELNNTQEEDGNTAFKTFFGQSSVSGLQEKATIKIEDSQSAEKEVIDDYILNNPALEIPPDFNVEMD